MRKITAICIGLAVYAAAAFPVYAGTWVQDASGWWYRNDDGTYPAGGWQWIDGNGDGTAECYYFYPDGYMAYNNSIDGYHVNDAGQWVVGDRVQKKTVSGAASSVSSGRDMSYARYCRGINSLWADATEYGLGYYSIYLGVSPETMTDLGDCWKVNDVQVYLPYEYTTKSQAQAQLDKFIRNGSEEYGDGIGNISRNHNGTYSIHGMDDMVYSYQVKISIQIITMVH